LCQGVRLKYAFIKQRAGDYSIRRLCLTLKVHPSGYYAWLSEPQSARAKDDQRLLGLIKHSWLESGGVYGYRKIHDDLREVGEDCGRHRVARLMRLEGLRSQTGYRRRPGKYGGKPAVASPNLLKRQFDVGEPNKVWVAESFFQLLKRERIKRKIYITREDARSDVFDYIEMFYNAKRRHGFNNQLSPVEFEKRYAMSLQRV
ncbi:hypothetical protein DD985_17230, partial [Pseudomonas sp. HMWF011]|uniref:IS3 family transposase n=1 Tax=Pseudomonas sp. HMWF011 TaxID=2056848 RepID=UPI000D58374B